MTAAPEGESPEARELYMNAMKDAMTEALQHPITNDARHNTGHREGSVARTIEQQAVKLPSDAYGPQWVRWVYLSFFRWLARSTPATLSGNGRRAF
jgi:hypothetical protein